MSVLFTRHLIHKKKTVRDALVQLNKLASDAILFVVDEENRLVGSLTDGDVRRGLLMGKSLIDPVTEFIQPNPKFIKKSDYHLDDIIDFREGNFRVIPIVNDYHAVVNVVNFRIVKSYLPIDAVLMAGGRGMRLKPLTDHTPKPLLKVGEKPVIEHNIDRLISYGIDDFWLSIGYLGHQIQEYFEDGKGKNISIQYVHETEPLGTLGAVSQIDNFKHDSILITNSDILTNLDYEDFYLSFIDADADLSVVTIPYEVNVPYAVLETSNGHVISFKEKPTYTYYSNGGIYLVKRKILNVIPENKYYNATELMQDVINTGGKVHSYPLLGYWLDIGKHEDFERAQEDLKHIKF